MDSERQRQREQPGSHGHVANAVAVNGCLGWHLSTPRYNAAELRCSASL